MKENKVEFDAENEIVNSEYEVNDTDDVINEIRDVSAEASNVIKLPPVKEWCSTGCTTLDLAISNTLPGGIPIGRVVHVFGGKSTTKTVLACTVLGYAQRSGKIAHFADIEHTLDPQFASIYGLDCNSESFNLGNPESIEGMFDDYIGQIIYPNYKKKGAQEKVKKKIDDRPKVIVIDSVSALPTRAELDNDMIGGTFGLTRPKMLSSGFRKWILPISSSNTTLFCIDQTRINVGQMFGDKEVVSGGKAMEFYSSVQIHLKHDSNVINSKNVITGIWVKAKIVKNKVAPPFRECRFKISFDYGLDDIASNIYFLALDQLGEKRAKGKIEKVKIFGEEHTQPQWIKIIETENREEDLKQEVWKVWKEMYKTEQRKPRVW